MYRNRRGQFAKKPKLHKVGIKGLVVPLTIIICMYLAHGVAVAIDSVEPETMIVEQKRGIEVELVGVVNWTPERIERAIRETFPEDPDTAIAIAHCESRLDQNAIGPTGDFGLMQVHSHTWDSVAKDLRLDYKNSIEDNLRMARHIYEQAGKSWTPWVCFTRGLI